MYAIILITYGGKGMVKVENLLTNESRVYSLKPREAVIAAYLQDRGNFNTWEYPEWEPEIIEGFRTVSCGNWVAIKKEERDAD
jgi:hypothetical protein